MFATFNDLVVHSSIVPAVFVLSMRGESEKEMEEEVMMVDSGKKEAIAIATRVFRLK